MPRWQSWKTSRHSPVTFHLIAEFLDVTKPTAGVALLLVSMVTVTGHVTSFTAGVAELLPLLFGFLAVPGNVATPVAVVARCKGITSCQKFSGKGRWVVKHLLLLLLL